MQPELIIGIDAGTSVIKAVAFDLQGRQIALASVPNRVLLGPEGAAEQDMAGTWTDTARALQLLAAQLPDLAQRTRALAATGQGDGTWLVDAQGEPVGPALLWLDRRAAPFVQALRTGPWAQALAQRTGTALNPSMQSGQLLWLQAQHPERLRQASSAMHCKDWLYFKATGERATCDCEATFTFGDYRRGDYDAEVLDWLGLSAYRHLLPPAVAPGRRQAPLTPQAAAQTGLRVGTPVVLPGMDVPLTLLGGGGVAYGPQGLLPVGCSILGSTGMHGWVSTDLQAIAPSTEAGYTMLMPIPGLRARLMSHMAATLNIDWLLGLLAEAAGFAASGPGPARAELLARLNDLVLAATPAQAVFHPYVAENGERGPFVNPYARAQLSGFSATLGLAGLARSVFEGIALAARDCYLALGPLPQEIRLSGGGARSPALRQLLATVLDRPVRVARREESGAAGAALVAATALGLHASVRDGLALWVDPYLDSNTTQPDHQQTALYAQLYPCYRAMATQAHSSWQALAALRIQPPF